MSQIDDSIEKLNCAADGHDNERESQSRADRIIHSNGPFLWRSFVQALESEVQRVNERLKNEAHQLRFKRLGNEKVRACRARYPSLCSEVRLDLDGHRIRFASVLERDAETNAEPQTSGFFRIRAFGSDLQLANGEEVITVTEAVELILSPLLEGTDFRS